MAVLVVLGAFDPAVAGGVSGCDVVEAPWIVGPHAHAGLAVHHPTRQLAPQPRPVRDADLDAHQMPEVPQARGPHHRLAVGRVGDRAADHLLDAQRRQHRHPLESTLDPQADTLEVGVEQRVLQRPFGTVALAPHRLGAGLLVNADQPGLLLLADIAGHVIVTHHRQLPVESGELVNSVSHQIRVQDVRHRHVQAHESRHTVREAPGGVHDMLGVNRSVLGDDIEAAVASPVDPQHTIAPADPRPGVASGSHHGVDRAGRVDMAVIGRVDRAEHLAGLIERMQSGDLAAAYPFHGVAHVIGGPELASQPVDLLTVVGDSEAAAAMPGGRNAALLLE